MVHLILAEYEGKAIAGALLIPFGESVYFYKVGWSGEHPKLFPIRLSTGRRFAGARAGYRYFNIMGVDGELARKIERGEPLSERKETILPSLSWGFGGEPVRCPALRLLPGRLSDRSIGICSGNA
jgi:hypothetical protein